MINELIQYFENNKILILGFGLEGKSTYKLIRKYLPNKKIYISDKKEDLKNECELIKDDNNIEVNSGSTYLDDLDNYDVIMKSPGISLKDMDLSNTRKKIKSQLELLLEFFKIYTIGITGTKGKSTTSSLIYKVLKDQGKEVLLLGNIGTPVFDWIDEIKENMYLVLEMSSHQLEFMDLSPNIAILLNIYEEHLDHYKSLDSYIDAKCNIFSHQKKSDYYIYNADISKIIDKNIKLKTDSTKYAVTLKDNLAKEDNIVTYKNEKIYINNIEVYDTKNDRKLLGMHNLNNIMFVLAISKILNLDILKTITTINSFEALPHRIEYVGKYNDITFYNDSIATIPEAAINSIEALKNVNTLIIGGLDRGVNFDKFINYLDNSNIENIICLPTTGHKIGKQMSNVNIKKFYVESIEDAVDVAKKCTKKNSICLLSPAAASYGFFKNFEERGNKFKELVKKS